MGKFWKVFEYLFGTCLILFSPVLVVIALLAFAVAVGISFAVQKVKEHSHESEESKTVEYLKQWEQRKGSSLLN